jgi:hypothetical protein
MHNARSFQFSAMSNTAVERTAQSCALGALRGCAAARLRRSGGLSPRALDLTKPVDAYRQSRDQSHCL